MGMWLKMVENEFTTISLRHATKERLDNAKLHPDESYEHLLNRLLEILEKSYIVKTKEAS